MTLSDLALLTGPTAQQLINQYAAQPPHAVALKLATSQPPLAALVATQVALLQHAADKLPSWVAAGALLERQAYEQASSEAAASLRPHGNGRLAVDLTTGLGVDAWMLSHAYEQVIAVEADAVLAALLQENLARLGRTNITVVHSTAQAWLQDYRGLTPDFVFIDPSRRTTNTRKAIALADCQPDVRSLLPQLLEMGARVQLKLSPLFEVVQGLRELPKVVSAAALAVQGECKEVVFTCASAAAAIPLREAWLVRRGEQLHFQGSVKAPTPPIGLVGNWMYEPDVALDKAGLWAAYYHACWPGQQAVATGKNGYYLSQERKEAFAGRSMAVVNSFAYHPRKLRQYLRSQGINQANLGRRQLPYSVAQLRAQLQLPEGGRDYFLFTQTQWGAWCWHCLQP